MIVRELLKIASLLAGHEASAAPKVTHYGLRDGRLEYAIGNRRYEAYGVSPFQSEKLLKLIKRHKNHDAIEFVKPFNPTFIGISETASAGNLNSINVIRTDWGTFEARQDGDNTILLSPKFFKLDKRTQQHVLLHEVGHWFRNKYVSLTDIMGWEPGDKFYDLFSAGNSEEGFAEAFAVYVGSPSELKSRYPEQYEQMKKYVGSSNAFKSWTTDKIDEVL